MRDFIKLVPVLLLLLADCSFPAATDYSYTPPESIGGRLCTDQCGQAKGYCRRSCDLDDRQCTKDVQSQALKDYDGYTRQQFNAGAPIEFRARDFERLAPCDDKKKQCVNDCESHYASCYKNCGGSVELKNPCRFLCFW
jgi:hypothetical protein